MRTRYTLIFIFISSFLFFFSLGILNRIWVHYGTEPLLSSVDAIDINVKKGASLNQLMSTWEQQGILINPVYFKLLSYLHGHTKDLQAGEYHLLKGITSFELLQKIVNGDVTQYQFTLVEGWTINQLIQHLNEDPHLQGVLYPAASEEGLFYPDTYHFTAETTANDLLQRAHNAMMRKLNSEWQLRAENLPFKNPYEALIAASIIEKETALANEKPLVASVICNRLKLNMPLQVDPTVIYGLGQRYHGHLSHHDMRQDTKYNTYLHRGLPPTPIAMPSLASLKAVLHPANTQFYYFVANGLGGHVFSETLKEQRKAIKQGSF